MKKTNPLRITVSSPCTESWENMSPEDKGRFCQSCKKTIIDFSTLSDQELYRYLSAHAGTTCGRFHNDQLNRNIGPSANTHSLSKRFSNAAAVLFTFLAMRSAAAAADGKQPQPTIQLGEKDQSNCYPENFVVSGNVRDIYGNNLEKAEILIGDSIVAITDKEGKFEFKSETDNPFIFTIRFPGLITVARNYHPAMQSTNYNIALAPVLSADYYKGYIMGGISVETINMPPVAIDLNNNNKLLSPEIKLSLSELAVWMRNHPSISVTINAYINNQKQTALAKRLQAQINKFLSEYEGIPEERIKTEILVVESTKQSLLEFTSSSSANTN